VYEHKASQFQGIQLFEHSCIS